jgi:hypothetical protein
MTDLLDVAESTGDVANGHTGPAANPWAELPAGDEKFARFGDPRQEAIRILRERLERVLQPVEEDEVWHGVNVVTAKDLEAAVALDLPPASIFSASVRTPAFVYVSAVCPVCGIVSEIDVEISAKLEVEGTGRKLKLRAKSTAKPHQCGQLRVDDLVPTRPEQLRIDELETDAGDVDFGEGAPNAEDDTDDSAAEADALHALAMTEAPAPSPDSDDGSVEPDDLDLLPF